jgi:hypothetical protein
MSGHSSLVVSCQQRARGHGRPMLDARTASLGGTVDSGSGAKVPRSACLSHLRGGTTKTTTLMEAAEP